MNSAQLSFLASSRKSYVGLSQKFLDDSRRKGRCVILDTLMTTILKLSTTKKKKKRAPQAAAATNTNKKCN